ncbi:hypothetical protein [Okeania sp. KiyG1]|uniref:hypothetical protein n=1 Tax=Okeania sp. KiyG1 TaxID=2720165 RepID=UPI0019227876|nr:hypothetical protein [Okeania sp. KiyG1]GGA14075.1 hypothetical protein CYANOKiyG1_27560 [Okeania sp. KiyG1]
MPELPSIPRTTFYPNVPNIDLNSLEVAKNILMNWSPYQVFSITDTKSGTLEYYVFIHFIYSNKMAEPYSVSDENIKGIKDISMKCSHLGTLTASSTPYEKKELVDKLQKSLVARDFLRSLARDHGVARLDMQAIVNVIQF